MESPVEYGGNDLSTYRIFNYSLANNTFFGVNLHGDSAHIGYKTTNLGKAMPFNLISFWIDSHETEEILISSEGGDNHVHWDTLLAYVGDNHVIVHWDALLAYVGDNHVIVHWDTLLAYVGDAHVIVHWDTLLAYVGDNHVHWDTFCTVGDSHVLRYPFCRW